LTVDQPATFKRTPRGIAIGIDLDAVAFGIVEIDGFADEVIGEAGQRDLVGGRVHQPARQILARRHQERGVIEPCRVARLAHRALAPLQMEQRHAARAEQRAHHRARHDGQPDRVAIVIGDLVEVSHPQVHHADPHRRPVGEGRPAAACRALRLRRGNGRCRQRRGAGEVKQRAAGQVDGHAGFSLIRARLSQASQFSTFKPRMRLNSSVLAVTIVAPVA
jgi:hypothetical protein